MAKQVTVLKIFVASPGDVAEERIIVDEVVATLNKATAKHQGLMLEVVKWETDTYPDIGSDGQDVINRQIGDDYDIFLAIMWTRFGSPTQRTESGTVEEYDRAVDRFRADPNMMRVLFYFKDEAIAPSKIQPDQLAKISQLKSKLQNNVGQYYFTFPSKESFKDQLNIHLANITHGWGKEWGGPTTLEIRHSHTKCDTLHEADQQLADSSVNRPDEHGFMEHFIQAFDAAEQCRLIMEDISSHTTQIGNTFTLKAEELRLAGSAINPTHYTFKRAKMIIDKTGENLYSYAEAIEAQASELSKHFSQMINSLSQAFLIADLREADRVLGFLDQLSGLDFGIREAGKACRQFRSIVEQTPRATATYNRAKTKTVSSLSTLDNEFNAGLRSIDALKALIQEGLGP